jgi:catechol 2,3-dioxygenase-like lactoylglutathione lyase family enzyme
MPVQLAKSAVDLGVVVRDGERSLSFYCGLLGFEHVGDMPMPIGGGGTMHRVQCGDSLLKLICFDSTPSAAAGGGIPGALGYRYVTMIVSNLDEVMQACAEAEAEVAVAVPISQIREGVRIGIVEDPDGNWVEFVETA